jgi:uncharacterized protein YndB with AHSA1/START domain
MAKDRVNTGEMLVINRQFDAPPELVFNAFTDPEHLMRWWGPGGYKMVYCKLDLRAGGKFHYCARSPEGEPLWGRFVYHEILAFQRIIFVNSFADEYNNLTPTLFPGWPREMLNKVIFTEHQGLTSVTLTSQAINIAANERKTLPADFNVMKNGFNGTLDQLENHLTRICSLQKL